jgi:hypothetical protein
MKLNINHIIIIVLGIIIIYLSNCSSNNNNLSVKPIKVFRTDSIFVHTTDTFLRTIHVPYKSIPLSNIEYNIDLSDTNVFKDTLLNGYNYNGVDSLLSYSIFVESKVKPVDVKLKYDLTSFTIHDTISTYIRDSVYNEAPMKSYVSLGATILGGNQFGLAPQLFYNHKSGNNLGLGYDVINQNIHITYLNKISFRK